jgi:hypothetical protein
MIRSTQCESHHAAGHAIKNGAHAVGRAVEMGVPPRSPDFCRHRLSTGVPGAWAVALAGPTLLTPKFQPWSEKWQASAGRGKTIIGIHGTC